MQKVIEKAGFKYQGDIILPDVSDGERKAYQVII
jgi:RimJ/RimL family protein N-acetyltransferase